MSATWDVATNVERRYSDQICRSPRFIGRIRRLKPPSAPIRVRFVANIRRPNIRRPKYIRRDEAKG